MLVPAQPPVKIVTPKCKTHFPIEVAPILYFSAKQLWFTVPNELKSVLKALNFHLVLREQVLLWVTSWNLKSPGFERVALKNCVQHVFTTTVAYGYSYLWCLRAVLWLFFFLESRRECSCSGLSNEFTSTSMQQMNYKCDPYRCYIWNKQSMCWRGLHACKKEEHPKRLIKDWTPLVGKKFLICWDRFW